ncbi:MAG: cytochrome c peroxidase [Flavobacteriales bacterium]
MKFLKSYIVLGLVLFLVSCKKEKELNGIVYNPTRYELDYRGLTPPNIPADNSLTTEGVELGRMLFYEKALSRDGTLSCGSCHSQSTGFSDTNRFSTGVLGLQGGRQAMAITNMLWNSNQFFWDGRANLLREQALLPIQDTLEMHETLPNVVQKLNNSQVYKNQFFRAFGTTKISSHRISLALEQFMNSIVSNNSKFDQEERGEVTFTASEQRGKDLFYTEFNPFFPATSGADCAHCHSGANFENDQYINNGLDSDAAMTDIGRMEVTMDPNDKGKFKITSLRNIELTPPYMHDGRFSTLEEVVDHYNNGLVYSTTIDPALEATRATGLFLTPQDKMDLVNFLKTLTDRSLSEDKRYSSPF